jgi:hypothetical protein
MPRRLLRRALPLVAYLCGVALFFEVAARLALSSDPFFERVTALNAGTAWRLRWVRRQQDAPRLDYSFDVHHPTRGWALRPGIPGVRAWDDRVLSSNSRGLRGPREYAYEKPEGTTRIVVIGDSFTFGHEVGDEETYSHVLEELLPGVEVLNLGVHGYGHGQMLLYLREEGVRYQPDVVLLGFLSDDMERNVIDFRDYAKPRFDIEGGELRLSGVPVPTPEETLRWAPWRSSFLDLVSLLWTSYRWRSGWTPRYTRDLTVAILDEIAATARAAGATPAFAYLPVYGEIDKREMSMTRREQFFFSYCRERGIQSMYLRHAFLPKVKAGVEFKTTGHWGPLEHRTAAEGIKSYLVEKELIDRPPAP